MKSVEACEQVAKEIGVSNSYRELMNRVEGKPKPPPKSFPDKLHRSWIHRFSRLCKQLADQSGSDTNQAAKFLTDQAADKLLENAKNLRTQKRLES